MQTAIDLSRFCDRDHSYISRPWVESGVRYASDGRIIVAVPADGEPSSEHRHPNGPDILKGFPDSADWMPWPEPAYVDDMADCLACDGTGDESTENCPECDGAGTTTCPHCFHEDDCDECDGAGVIRTADCVQCGGTGRVLRPARIEVAGRWFAWDVDQLVRLLPNPEFAHDSKDRFKTWLVFDGGRGVVMALSRDA